MNDYIQGEKFRKLGDENKIYYRDTHDLNNFFDTINFEHDFVLVSHNSDGCISNYPKRDFDINFNKIPKNCKKWFAQNIEVIDSRIESIPIGLENSIWFPEIRKIEKLFNKNLEQKNIKNLVYLNLNILNNPKERQPIYDMLSSKEYVTTIYGRNGISYDEYLDNLYNHKFMICPEGNGIDVHQPWESLYIGTIPIQKKNINNSNWRELPICWLDDWSQLEDEVFLNKEYDRISNSIYDKTKMYYSYWYEKIITSI